MDDCVDVLNPKVIRSTAGSLFHLPVLAMSTDEFFTWTGDHNMDVWAADVYGTEERKPEACPQYWRTRRRSSSENRAVRQ